MFQLGNIVGLHGGLNKHAAFKLQYNVAVHMLSI